MYLLHACTCHYFSVDGQQLFQCLAFILPTPSNVNPCQKQQAFWLCRPSSLWLQSPSWKPPALLSKPTEAVCDYMCGYPPLHHIWIVERSRRGRSGQRGYRTRTHHSSCCSSLKSGRCAPVSLRLESRKVGGFGKRQVHWTQIKRYTPHSFLWPRPEGTLEW